MNGRGKGRKGREWRYKDWIGREGGREREEKGREEEEERGRKRRERENSPYQS